MPGFSPEDLKEIQKRQKEQLAERCRNDSGLYDIQGTEFADGEPLLLAVKVKQAHMEVVSGPLPLAQQLAQGWERKDGHHDCIYYLNAEHYPTMSCGDQLKLPVFNNTGHTDFIY